MRGFSVKDREAMQRRDEGIPHMSEADPGHHRSLGETVSAVAHDLQQLIRGEIGLARAEISEKLKGMAGSAAALVLGGLLAFAGLIVLIEGIAAVLALWLPIWAALLITGIVVVAVAGLICMAAMSGLGRVSPMPNRTGANISRDIQVAKEHV